MPKNSNSSGDSRLKLTRTHKYSIAGVATLSAAALAFTLIPSGGSEAPVTEAAAPAAFQKQQKLQDVSTDVTGQRAVAEQKAKAAADRLKAQKDQRAAEAKQAVDKTKTERAAEAKADAEQSRQQPTSASRAAARTVSYANNLDGWIRESLDVMKKNDIPGSYNGLYRNIIRESSGNPRAINLWDINARNGIPSKGLLQVIPPTFSSYHVSGTPFDIYHPVSNITAAANYAADRYGSIDNVFGAY
ncbi:transglycosylase SLT domain-containing protein [Streptomyces sp. SID4919]|uniref:transglycosylase SLT domain-containing protein n=1 Tax=unclassified Streptomyces TaxID=2593676 RepID=UPI000823770C|nr:MULTISPECIES: transglycosylase SLT domain-containing protein [unclassified Streptomyces]MYY07508.1 transglycosylase SLT domain-containing protein [Streptomyces sp. SID4919]SCK62821.1 Transglycosylase SLT domain-containing protein [Streptomyces sp. AmelKG-E11A]